MLVQTQHHVRTVQSATPEHGETKVAASVKQARRLYMDGIERCKKRHWADFLDDRDNIWKAYAYSKAAKVY